MYLVRRIAACVVTAAAIAAGAGFLAPGNQAAAQTAGPSIIQVPLLKATILKLSGRASNVIIGNPGVADVTVENPGTLVLFGRGPGETNILVFDSAQKQILSASIVVAPDKEGPVSVISPSTGKSSGMIEILYACADRCVRFPANLTKLATQTGSGGPTGGQAQPAQAASAPQADQAQAAQPQTGNDTAAR